MKSKGLNGAPSDAAKLHSGQVPWFTDGWLINDAEQTWLEDAEAKFELGKILNTCN
jgi:hypothetical protein